MALLILDRRPAYLQSATGEASLLSLPLGSHSVLDHLVASLTDMVQGDILVMPTFDCNGRYPAWIRSNTSADVRVVRSDELAALLGDCETADVLLVVDPGRWPLEGFDLAGEALGSGAYRGATHVIAVGSGNGRARESIELDDSGQIRRVRRLYDSVNWPEVADTAVVLSSAPAMSLADIRFDSLLELRTHLFGRGVLTHDIPVASGVVDLLSEEGLLAVSEWIVDRALQHSAPATFESAGPQVLLGHECNVHSSARIVGPVIVHRGAILERNVTVIGPTVIGPDSRIGSGAVVAQSVVAGGSKVPPESTVCRRVVAGVLDVSPESEGARSNGRLHAMAPAEPQRPLEMLRSVSESVEPRSRRVQLKIKRVADVVAAVGLLVALLPLLLLAALLVKLDSRGPVFFTHRRERRDGSEFPCIKFRTMVAGAHGLQQALYAQNVVDGPQFKLKKDPRITRVGRFLRSTNLDEIPQLFNVVLGHMSLVGPRPSPFRENQLCVPWRRARLSVSPGITGLWQICRSNDRSGGDFHEWIYYDMTYVRHFSLWLDVKILLATLLSLGGRWSVPLSRIIRSNHLQTPYRGEPIVA